MTDDYAHLRQLALPDLRQRIRHSSWRGHTAGLACGYLQANVVIVPESQALDFSRFCQRNPKPCPLVGVSDTGDPKMRTLGSDIDVRSDIPRYTVYRHGEAVDTPTDIRELWQPDHVAFALGCSFTFEHALMQSGIAMWHVDNDRTVPMYRTDLPLISSGVFGGEMVVSMRTIAAERIDDVVRLCRRFPLAHGVPVQVGEPDAIGIRNLREPDWGDAPELPDDAVPVFWACGVTTQQALIRAALPLAITHAPGHMLISDVDDQAEVAVLPP